MWQGFAASTYWLKSVQYRLFPAYCLLCGAISTVEAELCPGCRRSLPIIGNNCPRCAGRYTGDGPCGQCQKQPPAFAVANALFDYAPPVDQLILGLKYHRRLNYARVLGELLATHLEKTLDRLPELIVPVPLHPSRLRERGYNQALEIARPVARHLGIALDYHCTRRVRATPPQTGLPRRQRHGNVHGAFALPRTPKATRIAIVDDVMTSGHTVNELAGCLRRAGVRHIEVWVVARA